MDTKLYDTLEDVTNNLTALKQTHIFIGKVLLPVYGETIKTKKELAKYIYNGGIYSSDGDYIHETTKSYFKYFEDI